MSSRCTPETVRGTRAFEIVGYSMHKGLGNDNYIRSATFSVGGYEWGILYYPDWCIKEEGEEYIFVFIKLMSKGCEVRFLLELRLVEEASGQPLRDVSQEMPTIFKVVTTLCYSRFMRRSDLEASPYLQDDCLMIECEISHDRVQDIYHQGTTSEADLTALVEKEPSIHPH
ncbi:hypothetical protein ACQ4PT_057117 [Festuca glaucescens]